MTQNVHVAAAITVVTIALILMFTFGLDSSKLRANVPPEYLHKREEDPVIMSPRKTINNLEKELSFLNPEILACEEIFGRHHQNKREFEHIWSELKKYDLILETVKSEVSAKNIKKPCHEGYSYKYTEEGQIMAKLAR